MKKIVLHVNDESVETLMHILNNLKEGLITKVETDGIKRERKASYTPNNKKVVYEDDKPTGKYVSTSTYKSRLKKNK